MDKIIKFLKKLTEKERIVLKPVIAKLKAQQFDGLDVKRLKDAQDFYRVKKGDIRIIYTFHEGEVNIIAIRRRSEKTYRDL